MIVFIWIALWQLAAMAIQNRIIFVGPLDAAGAFVSLVGTSSFWAAVSASFLRIAAGFFLAFAASILAAFAAARFPLFREFLEPFIGLLQAVPVASFVILALIWIGSKNLSVLTTFLVVFPFIYQNILEGILQTDKKLLEMAEIFGMSPLKKLLYLYRPAIFPYLLSGCRVTLGMAWKSGVAAEVIGVSGNSIGEKLYMAKIYLETGELFAWTFVIVVLSYLFKVLVIRLLEFLNRDITKKHSKAHMQKISGNHPKKMNSRADRFTENPGTSASVRKTLSEISFTGVCKSYQAPVLHEISLSFSPGGIYCLLGPSGCGKTTFLRLFMELEKPDKGEITGKKGQSVSAVFQEDRLLEYASGLKNAELTAADRETAMEILNRLLKPEEYLRPVSQLSGGMKRRVAIARALAASSEILLMDEPFTGLDEMSRQAALETILKYRNGRTLLLVTHQEADAKKLQAHCIRLAS